MRYVPVELVSADQVPAICRAARRLPDALTHHFRIEAPIGPSQNGPELILKIPGGDGRDILAGSHRNIGIHDDVMSRPALQRAREFCADWRDPRSILHGGVDGLWLQFVTEDIEYENIHRTFIFFEPRRGAAGHYQLIYARALSFLQSAPGSELVRNRLAVCLDCAAPNVQVLSLGVLQSETADSIELGLFPNSTQSLFEYLESIGWDEPAAELRQFISPICELRPSAEICLRLTISETAEPDIGVEFYFNGLSGAERESGWDALLSRLVDLKLCSQPKRRALLGFPGYSIERSLYDRVFLRGLYLIRFNLRPGRLPEGSACIGTTVRPLEEFGSNKAARG